MMKEFQVSKNQRRREKEASRPKKNASRPRRGSLEWKKLKLKNRQK